MRNLFYIFITLLLLITSCSQNNNKKGSNGDYVGTFVTDEGLRFTLNADSTATIYFSDSLIYDASWKPVVSSDNWKYANIEFAGYLRYYYLHDSKLYRSEREMRSNFNGDKVTYTEN